MSLFQNEYGVLIIFALIYVCIRLIFIAYSSFQPNIQKILFLLSPLFFLLGIIIIFDRFPYIYSSQINIIDILTLFSISLVLLLYFKAGTNPAYYASKTISTLRELFSTQNNDQITFWNILDKIRLKRMIVMVILFTSIVIVLISNAFLLIQILSLPLISSYLPFVNIGIFISILLGLFIIKEITTYGKVEIQIAEHGRQKEIESLITNISIAYGISPPLFKVLAHSSPTAFSISKFFQKPNIYITSSLINISNRSELESIIAHEITHIHSGLISDYRLIYLSTIALRILGFSLFLLFLWSINLTFVVIWIFLVFTFMVHIFIKESKYIASSSLAGSIPDLANPPFVFITILSYFIYYSLTHNEDFYADVKSIQITRNPKPLHSILQKIKSSIGFFDELPRRFFHLYFTGEQTYSHFIPMSQPTIEERLRIIEEIDATLHEFKPTQTMDILCPRCNKSLNEIVLKSHYGTPVKLDMCNSCGGIWFDNFELWFVAKTALRNSIINTSVDLTLYRLNPNCPKCKLSLFLLKDYSIPKTIQIWRCSTCNGNWIDNSSLFQFISK